MLTAADPLLSSCAFLTCSQDLHTLDLRHFYSSRCNLTGFQLVDPDKPGLKNHQDERVVAGADPLAMLSPRAKEFQRSVKVRARGRHLEPFGGDSVARKHKA